jgi:hypothetical protein
MAPAQVFVPAKSALDPAELNSRTNYPLMRAQSRSQYVVDASEIGTGPTSLTKLALPYDGPAFGAAGGTLASLDVYLANSTVTAGTSSAYFDANYTGTLTRVAALTNHVFGADASVLPSPWGGPSGELVFTFSAPFAYSGNSLVVELRASGNTNVGSGIEDCLLDLEQAPLVGAAPAAPPPTAPAATARTSRCRACSPPAT